jgi:hypothetical protein
VLRHSECSDTDGSLVLSWGQCTMRADPGLLTLRAEAADQEGLTRIQDLVAGRLEKFGRREASDGDLAVGATAQVRPVRPGR